jgi:hypothetical protein
MPYYGKCTSTGKKKKKLKKEKVLQCTVLFQKAKAELVSLIEGPLLLLQ